MRIAWLTVLAALAAMGIFAASGPAAAELDDLRRADGTAFRAPGG